jgi:hypothetical protein
VFQNGYKQLTTHPSKKKKEKKKKKKDSSWVWQPTMTWSPIQTSFKGSQFILQIMDICKISIIILQIIEKNEKKLNNCIIN